MAGENQAPARGAIRNVEAFIAAAKRRRTERFSHCFPRGISFGDIDSFVEIGNRFLFVEWKLDNQPISMGQALAFARLAKLPGVTFWVIWTDAAGEITHGRDMGKPLGRRGRITEAQVCESIARWISNTSLPTGGAR